MGKYIRLVDFGSQQEKENAFLRAAADKSCGYAFDCQTEDFGKIPGSPIAYWASEKIRNSFEIGENLVNVATPKQGLATTDNNRFLRIWSEVFFEKIKFHCSRETAKQSKLKWFPINKGGEFRKWYGNNDFIVNYQFDGIEIKKNVLKKYSYLKTPDFVVKNQEYYFKECGTWSAISMGEFSVRYCDQGFVPSNAGMAVYSNNNNLLYVISFLNCCVNSPIIKCINESINFNAGDIEKLPIVFNESKKPKIDNLVQENIDISKADWGSFETSWEFEASPLIKSKELDFKSVLGVSYQEAIKGISDPEFDRYSSTIKKAYENYKKEVNGRFDKLKLNEEELNRLFIEIYGLADELTADVAEKDVTVARIFDIKAEIPESMKGNRYVLTREDVVKDFVSYAVGCMFGRYSPYKDGLIFAGGKFDFNTYIDIAYQNSQEKDAKKFYAKTHFEPVLANVLPITSRSYFDSDVVEVFCDFVEDVYGAETLEQNLTFIAQNLGVKGTTSRDIIRNYFINDFYADHVKKYKKRPIYWQLDSGKAGGFKALFYLHRFGESTLPTARVDYLHELQFKYNFEIERLKKELDKPNLTTADKTAINKQITILTEKVKEAISYDQVLSHACNLRITLDLDDGVKVNYTKLQDLDGTTATGLLTNIKL